MATDILIVDDEADIRKIIAGILQDEGYTTREAGNSAEALQMLSRHNEISIMITDVNMPGQMNGLGLIAQVRCDHPDIRSIVVSGHSSAVEASKAGATGFLPKPYMAQTMVQAVLDTVRRHLAEPKSAFH